MDYTEGYVYSSEEERKQVEVWYRKHGKEIISLEAGDRINGDPIIYLGIPEDWQLRALMEDSSVNDPIDADWKEQRNSAINQLIRIAVVKSDLTPLQAWALALGCHGCKQDVIANKLKVTQSAISQAIQSAARKLHSAENITSP
jgi:hypothetical protein